MANQEFFNPFNIYFLVREVQSRFYTEDPKALLNNSSYQDLFKYLEQNISLMPVYTLVEVLTMFRKSF